jgi:hypothetical protein
MSSAYSFEVYDALAWGMYCNIFGAGIFPFLYKKGILFECNKTIP